MIERKANPNDSRSKILCLTQKTLDMKELLYCLGEELEAKLTDKLTTEEKQELITLLKKLLQGGDKQ